MAEIEPPAGVSRVAYGSTIPEDISERYKERVVVRRRRPGKHRRARRWSAGSARKRVLRTFAVCAGVLLLMALGLYFGLARQEAAPSDGAWQTKPPVVTRTTA